MSSKDFNIYVPSYGRAEDTTTFKFLEYCTYVVRKSEESAYLNRGIQNVWAVEDSLINNYVKVSNYINENAPEKIICTLDDDIDGFTYRLDNNIKFTDPVVITSELERIGQLMADLEIGFGAEDAASTPWNYCSEFSFKGTTGAIRWYNKDVYKSRYLEEVYHNCDLDVMLHELLVNRIILRPMYLCSNAKTDTNKGGNSSKTRQDQKDCYYEMKRKWGVYFDYNFDNNKPKINVVR